MRDGAESTRDNWRALRRLAVLLFARLRRENPDWQYEDLGGHLNLPTTKLFQELAEEAGFMLEGPLPAADQNGILKAMLRGVFGPEEIARETELPIQRVRQFLDKVGVPFGAGGFGMFSWPENHKGDARGTPAPRVEPRRVSRKGQFCYRGRKYGLGAACSGRLCWVEEAGKNLIVHLPGRPSVTLPKRAIG